MRQMILIVLFLSAGIVSAQDFDLPEVIGILRAPEPNLVFGRDFCWAGDQNGDGFDDLLLTHDHFGPGLVRENTNQVKLFFGGDEIDDEPDVIFSQIQALEGFGTSIAYLPNLIPNHPPYLAITSFILRDSLRVPPLSTSIYLYEGGEDMDDEPEFTMRSEWLSRYELAKSPLRTNPGDYNGDGFNDLLFAQRIDAVVTFTILFGGEEFDTLADWRASTDYLPDFIGGEDYATGYDINDDGYDDFLVRAKSEEDDYLFKLYLGGEDMDTMPALEFSGSQFAEDDIYMTKGFTLLPDVNGDEYDDFAINYYQTFVGWHLAGVFLFFGGEEMDFEVDVTLEQFHRNVGADADVSGGDFNGDGYGDIVATLKQGEINGGAIQIYFGRPDIDGAVNIRINAEEDYGDDFQRLGKEVGAVGDYNGDGADDFVTTQDLGNDQTTLYIFAGNPNWDANVPDYPVPRNHDLAINVYPNPFNSTTYLSLKLRSAAIASVTIYDIHGRAVQTVSDLNLHAGRNSLPLDLSAVSGGIYFAQLSMVGVYRSQSKIVKLVNLK